MSRVSRGLVASLLVGSMFVSGVGQLSGVATAATKSSSKIAKSAVTSGKDASVAGFNARMDKAQDALENVDGKMVKVDNDLTEIEYAIASLREEKRYIEKRLELVEGRMEKKKGELETANLELAKLQNEIYGLETELKSREGDFRERVNSMYQSPTGELGGYLDVILSSDGFGEMMTQLSSYRRVVAKDNQVIEEYMEIQNELAEKEAAATRVIDGISASMKELAKLGAEVEKTLLEKVRIENELKRKEFELRGDLVNLKDKKASLKLELTTIAQEKKIYELKKKREEEAKERARVKALEEAKRVARELAIEKAKQKARETGKKVVMPVEVVAEVRLSETDAASIVEKLGSEKNMEINDLIDEKAKKYDVPANLVRAVIQQESGFNPNAVNVNTNGTIDRGLMQLNSNTAPGIARQMGLEYKVGMEFVPEIAVEFGAYYLGSLYDKENLHRTLSSYNRGSGGARTWFRENGTYETEYSMKVMAYKKVFDDRDKKEKLEKLLNKRGNKTVKK